MTLFITSDDGVNIAGQANVAHPNTCFPSATFAATRAGGGVINGGMVNGANVLGLQMNVNPAGVAMSGAYSVTQGACAGDQGSFAATRN